MDEALVTVSGIHSVFDNGAEFAIASRQVDGNHLDVEGGGPMPEGWQMWGSLRRAVLGRSPGPMEAHLLRGGGALDCMESRLAKAKVPA